MRDNSRIYDKHDDVDFPVVNIPFLSSNFLAYPDYEVYVFVS